MTVGNKGCSRISLLLSLSVILVLFMLTCLNVFQQLQVLPLQKNRYIPYLGKINMITEHRALRWVVTWHRTDDHSLNAAWKHPEILLKVWTLGHDPVHSNAADLGGSHGSQPVPAYPDWSLLSYVVGSQKGLSNQSAYKQFKTNLVSK